MTRQNHPAEWNGPEAGLSVYDDEGSVYDDDDDPLCDETIHFKEKRRFLLKIEITIKVHFN